MNNNYYDKRIEYFNFYSRYESGHRKEYIEFTKVQLQGSRVSLLTGVFNRKPLLFLMIEELFFVFCVICCFRSLFRLKTVGLVFRAKECATSEHLKHKIKRYLLKYFKKSQYIQSLSIIPFFVHPEIESFCDDWIYDFQFSDIEFLYSLTESIEIKHFSADLIVKAKGRKIVCAVGKQDKNKGFDKFIENYITSNKLQKKYLFVSGGKVDEACTDLIKQFEMVGGVIINRRISDSELVAFYEVADHVWCCYSPSYDQSSGVLGRAIQFQKGVIVRKGSVVESISDNLKANYLIMPDSSDELLNKLCASNVGTSSGISLFKQNINKFTRYLQP